MCGFVVDVVFIHQFCKKQTNDFVGGLCLAIAL
jgi:hypothetical protein